jgi:short-subunit dehydrogenase
VTVDLAGRRVLITGAARGIGAATAKRLHERGARVVLAGIEPEVLARTAAECGNALAISSLAAAVHIPLLGAYSASKAGVEALANTLRIELASSGARVGVGYFAELDTDMVRQGFGTAAAKRGAEIRRPVTRVSPLEVGIDAIERGIARRSRRVVAPRWVAAALPMRMLVQRAVDMATRSSVDELLEIARAENAPLTTVQPDAATRTRS